MSTHERSIFHLPSDFFFDDSMSPTEYCQALTFLPDRVPPNSTDYDLWRGTSWYPNRTPPRPDVARALHYGSIPDFDINFTDTRRPPVIGTGRPPPDSPAPPAPPAPKTLGKESAITNQCRIRLANAKLAKLQGSKLAKLFPQRELYGEPTYTNGVDQRIWNVQATYTLSPYRFQSKHDTARCGPLNPLVSKKVTFDLGAESDTPSTAEQKAEFRARAHQMTMEEGLALKRYNASEESSIHDRNWHTSGWTPEQEAESRARIHQTIKEETLLFMREQVNEQISRLDRTRHTLGRTTECRVLAHKITMTEDVDGQISRLDLIRYELGQIIEQNAECGASAYQMTGDEEFAFVQVLGEEMSRLDCRYHTLSWIMSLEDESITVEDTKIDEDEDEDEDDSESVSHARV